ALRWAQEHGVPVQFADLPATHQLADPPGDGEDAPTDPTNLDGPDAPDGTGGSEPDSGGTSEPVEGPPRVSGRRSTELPPEEGSTDHDDRGSSARTKEDTFSGRLLGLGGKVDPLGALAAAAGFADPERWWEDAVEHREGGLEVF